jgi:2-oxoisovalerate dehydrogenase E1 component
MATRKPAARSATSRSARPASHPLTKLPALEIYRLAYLSRRLDDREIKMKRQNQIFFQISGAGHEIPLICAGLQMRPGRDWFFPYYRDRALMLALGMTAEEILRQGVGARNDPNSGGRQMPCHWGSRALNVGTVSSCTGTQFLHAVGAAQVGRIADLEDGLRESDLAWEADEVMFVSSGDGTTSEGEFWEAVNSACNLRLPVLFLVEDNGYAISVPVEVNTAGGSISKLLASFPNLRIEEMDGCDTVETWKGMQRALEYVRSGQGPALVHAHVIRPYSHSLSDSEELYRPAAEREADARRDPLVTLPALLVEAGICREEELQAIRDAVDAEVTAATDAALTAPRPEAGEVLWHIWSDVDPTSDAFRTEPVFQPGATQATMVDLINSTLHGEMARNPRMVVFGEDVADASREEALAEVKGKGGVFKATHGLQRKFGGTRVFNSPLAEANIVGRAIGMAMRGLKPVVEIQFFDYIWPAYMQIRNELANVRWRSAGDFSCPVVIRVPIGGYLSGGGPYHSQSGEVLFTHIPGLRVVMPSTALDAAGLLRTAIRCDDPVLFLEPKHLYRQTYNKSADPGADFMIPFGSAKVVREGTDLTLLTYGCVVQRAVKAAQALAKEGIEVEVIDLRSLSPLDWDTIAASVKKTNRVLVSHEDHVSWGYGAELVSQVTERLFEYLDAPPKRVCGKDAFVAYAPALEDANLPQVDDLVAGARALAGW